MSRVRGDRSKGRAMHHDPIIQALADKQAIYELMVRYAERIDANDPAGAAACFAEDGIGMYWGEAAGRKAIAARLAGILDRFHTTSHHLSNVGITLDGDRATAMSYVYAFHRMAGTMEAMHVWGRWVDELARIDGEWLFTRREVVGVGAVNRGKDANGDTVSDVDQPGHPGRLSRQPAEDLWRAG
ncbi:MAG: hypothetical protein GC201_04420 [Alphaproteobacteria bacterium]|nr:hypothetical protein [Alphaproteobacteria bacterium]